MKRVDLGELQGPLLFFGGPYGNLQATQALKSYARQQNISAPNIICTGDTVAYCAQPNETIELLREWGVAVVLGNCEESLSVNAPDCGCGFERGSACNALAQNWYRYANQNIADSHRRWMGRLPGIIQFNLLRKRFAVIHGGVERINQFIFPSTGVATKLREIQAAQVDGIIAGHCGLPFTQKIDRMLWHNPGVIGMPANDGTSRVWFSLWYTENGKIKIEHRSLIYDVAPAHDAMLQAGLDKSYAQTLVNGLWPSMDVLPEVEKAYRAKALGETVHWY